MFLGQLLPAAPLERSTNLHYGLEAANLVLLSAAAAPNWSFTDLASHQITYNSKTTSYRFSSVSSVSPSEPTKHDRSHHDATPDQPPPRRSTAICSAALLRREERDPRPQEPRSRHLASTIVAGRAPWYPLAHVSASVSSQSPDAAPISDSSGPELSSCECTITPCYKLLMLFFSALCRSNCCCC